MVGFGVSTRSRPKAADLGINRIAHLILPFQHAAARRRLSFTQMAMGNMRGFNTQPPEGG